jgi:hypothetical protein
MRAWPPYTFQQPIMSTIRFLAQLVWYVDLRS